MASSVPLFVACVLATVLCVVATDFLALPPKARATARRPLSFGRRCTDLLVRGLIVSLVFAVFFSFSWRPLYATQATVSLFVIFTLISRIKYRFFRKPLVLSDFAFVLSLLRDKKIRHASWKGLLVWTLSAGYIFGGTALYFLFEPSLLPETNQPLWIGGGLLLAVLPWMALFLKGMAQPFSRLILPQGDACRDTVQNTARFGTFEWVVLSLVLWLSRPSGDRRQVFEQAHAWREYAAEDGRDFYNYAGLALDPLGPVGTPVKTIAFYLPQMHPIPENDAWWGKGFTEWTNVSKAVPRFAGHHQPRLPGELGYYDLRCTETMARQVELAKTYGVSAFCFYYYWFSGKRLLERPLDMFLENRDLKIDFCLCWANENWTRRWDGLESDVLISQNHTMEDSQAVFHDWLRYFADERYIKVEGKPLVLIYRPDLIPDFPAVTRMWRDMAIEAGLEGLHIVAAKAFRRKETSCEDLDGVYEFPPHNISIPQINERLHWFRQNHRGRAFSYGDAVNFALAQYDEKEDGDIPVYPGVLVGWDTEARKTNRGDVFVGSTPQEFRRWFAGAYEKATQSPREKFVFINAWNEWAEGAYLEPDRRHGYGFLTALRSVVRQYGLDSSHLQGVCDTHNDTAQTAKKKAVFLHIFYVDLLEEFSDAFSQAQETTDFDVIVTVPDIWTLENVEKAITVLKPRKIFAVPNVGRDVYPFLFAMRQVASDGYIYGCKVHSKKSTHRVDGHVWRNALLEGLLAKDVLLDLDKNFFAQRDYKLAAPHASFLSLEKEEYILGNREHLNNLIGMFSLYPYRKSEFVAGTMFWFRCDIFKDLVSSPLGERDFGVDLGQVDGTLAHAFERILALFCKKSNGEFYKISSGKQFLYATKSNDDKKDGDS